MAGKARCAAPQCSRNATPEYYPFCWQHYRMTSNYVEAEGGGVLTDEMRDSLVRPQTKMRAVIPETFGHYSDDIGMSKDDAGKISDAIDSWNPDDEHYDRHTIPSVAAKNQTEWCREFRDEMVSAGIDPSKIKLMQFQGIRRFVPDTGKQQTSNKFTHKAILLQNDEDENDDIIIDPSIAALAPVRYKDKRNIIGKVVRKKNADQPVDETFRSGTLPYGDSPFVTTKSDYLKNYNFRWSKSAIIDW